MFSCSKAFDTNVSIIANFVYLWENSNRADNIGTLVSTFLWILGFPKITTSPMLVLLPMLHSCKFEVFLFCLYHMVCGYVKLDTSWYKRLIFQDFRLFHKHTKLAILTLLLTLYFDKVAVSLQQILLVNRKLDISGLNRITFQGCRLHWSSSFLMAQIKTKLAELAFLYCVVCEKPYWYDSFLLAQFK